MPILFVAIPLPESVAQHLFLLQGGIPGARWEPPEKLHLTLRYIGDVDRAAQRSIRGCLQELPIEPFSVTLHGVGHFPPRGTPKTVWVGVEDPHPLRCLAEEVERRLAPLPIPTPARRFIPHVTLARLSRPPSAAVAAFLQRHNLVRTGAFDVPRIALMSSLRGPRGSKYRVESWFALGT